jgi:hypothetical protein
VKETSKALHYYYANQDTINAGHLGDYVAIANNKVQGYYKDFGLAFVIWRQKILHLVHTA